jgi:uncharacterized protein YjbI with pentapeptide repeats
MRQPADITHNDRTLAEILDLHARWRRGEEGGWRANLARADLARANLAGANLARANLAGAYLARANLADADLAGARGNMLEIKTAQFDTWAPSWTTAPDGVVTLQIGCQRHPLEMWRRADPRWIAAMDSDATYWWARYGTIVLSLVDASPATPWGTPTGAPQ